MKKTFISSDYHLSHKNIIKYDNRPFANVDEMNEAIIENHNSVIGNNDDFYFLGDFSFAPIYVTESFIRRLKGNLFFISGNHDKRDNILLYKKYGTYLGGYGEIKIDDIKIILSHYAMRVWNKSHHGSFHLYGHSHGSLEHTPWGRSMDVGIMLNNYYPFEFQQIKSILLQREIKVIDHHDGER